MADRIDSLLNSIDVATQKGLELGPLADPVVRRGMGDVRYLDHVDTDALRARYAEHDGFDVDAIVPIDYVSTNGAMHEAVKADIPFDYVIASHVIEHVPDLVGWLREIRSVLREDGILSLAIPDHRRCFDALRSPTVTADIVDAHLTKPTVPTPRQVFDHYSSAVAWHGFISWGEEPPFSELVPVHSESEALDKATAAVADAAYLDVHCWVFTPSSFRRLFAALQRLQLVPFSLERCSDTVGGEFFVTMHAETSSSTTPTFVGDGMPATASEHAALRAQLRSSQDDLCRTHSSRSWIITRPLRAFNQLRARRS